ncbi:MAG: 50S ribosomal protein L25 [Anaerolineae bacterium]|nr:50S ribosomal protein L25 [Anaerolineae bacterium]MDW8071104.1 50S ribosomal protein L25 [Anaerolineae bacterium]
MEQIELHAQLRTRLGKQVRQLRAQGWVPAVVYGSHYPSTPIQVEAKALQKTLARAGGSKLIRLQIAGREPISVLTREVQRDVLRHHIIHVDFQQVVMTEKITATVPLRLVGEAPAVRDLGGILVYGVDHIEVHCFPADLPEAVEVDLSVLRRLHDTITVGDLKLPETITVLTEPETMIAHIEAPRIAEAVEEAVTEAAAEEPELVRRRPEREAEEEA